MEDQWHYVEGGNSCGPITTEELSSMLTQGKLGEEDYIWRQGMENWAQVKEVSEFKSILSQDPEVPTIDNGVPDPIEDLTLNLSKLVGNENSIFIKIGADRGAKEVEYGPYSIEILKKLFSENRINAKTYIFTRAMTNWTMLADFEDFSDVFSITPPVIQDVDRRENQRKPFVARMYVENKQQVYLGVCRDISVGGMQVLVDKVPAKIGEKISINVHPENTDHHFVAGGQIVRILEGGHGFSFRFTELGDQAKEAIEKYLLNE
jgi:hypothetical protein